MLGLIFVVLTFSSVLVLAVLFGWMGNRSQRFGWIGHLMFVPVAIVTALVLSLMSMLAPPRAPAGFYIEAATGLTCLICWAPVAVLVIPGYYIRLGLRWSARRRQAAADPLALAEGRSA